MKRAFRLLLAGLVSLTVAAPARGQESHPLPAPGTHAISVNVPDGGGAGFSIRKILESGANLGLNVTFGASWIWPESGSSSHSYQLGIGPDVRLYRRETGPVVPFLHLGSEISYQGGSQDNWAGGLSADVGVGAEWLPLTSMSLAAWTGLGARYRHASASVSHRDDLSIGAFRSQLELNLYF